MSVTVVTHNYSIQLIKGVKKRPEKGRDLHNSRYPYEIFKKDNYLFNVLYHMNSAEANELLKALICFAQCAHLQVHDPTRMNKV